MPVLLLWHGVDEPEGGVRLRRYGETEGCAFTLLRRHKYLSSESVYEVRGDVQSKACSSILPRNALIRLRKRLKEILKLGGLDSNSGVRNREPHQSLVLIVGNSEFNPSLFRKFYGVAEEIDKDLLEPKGVAAYL